MVQSGYDVHSSVCAMTTWFSVISLGFWKYQHLLHVFFNCFYPMQHVVRYPHRLVFLSNFFSLKEISTFFQHTHTHIQTFFIRITKDFAYASIDRSKNARWRANRFDNRGIYRSLNTSFREWIHTVTSYGGDFERCCMHFTLAKMILAWFTIN